MRLQRGSQGTIEGLEAARARLRLSNACCMNKNVLPTFQTFRPVGVQTAQMVINFATFKFRPGKGVFQGRLGGVL